MGIMHIRDWRASERVMDGQHVKMVDSIDIEWLWQRKEVEGMVKRFSDRLYKGELGELPPATSPYSPITPLRRGGPRDQRGGE